ncbi:SRPBCC family protein [Nocardia sp. NPDC051030]|uniref:SRPBCC family protein n=1 Tax=Nocardia sp. NPDC051030 TaxID=3155162 RepID=UPI0034305161
MTFAESRIISGDITWIWKTASDPRTWPDWDPHVVKVRFDGPFAPGRQGWTKPHGGPGGPFTLVEVDPPHGYRTEDPMPGGIMTVATSYDDLGDGRIRVTRRVEVTGWFAPIFNFFWSKGMRRDMQRTFTALECEAQHRAAQRLPEKSGSHCDTP